MGEDCGAGVGDFAPTTRTAQSVTANRDNQRVRNFMAGSFPGSGFWVARVCSQPNLADKLFYRGKTRRLRWRRRSGRLHVGEETKILIELRALKNHLHCFARARDQERAAFVFETLH